MLNHCNPATCQAVLERFFSKITEIELFVVFFRGPQRCTYIGVHPHSSSHLGLMAVAFDLTKQARLPVISTPIVDQIAHLNQMIAPAKGEPFGNDDVILLKNHVNLELVRISSELIVIFCSLEERAPFRVICSVDADQAALCNISRTGCLIEQYKRRGILFQLRQMFWQRYPYNITTPRVNQHIEHICGYR